MIAHAREDPHWQLGAIFSRQAYKADRSNSATSDNSEQRKRKRKRKKKEDCGRRRRKSWTRGATGISVAVEDTRSFEYVLMHDDDQMSPTTDSMCGGDHCALVEPASKRARTSEHRISGVYHKLNSNTGWVKDPELLTEARSHRDRQRQRRRKIFWEKKKKILDSWSDGHLRGCRRHEVI